jgi:uncharacterized protein
MAVPIPAARVVSYWLWAVLALGAAWVGLSALVYFGQEVMLFHPRPQDLDARERLRRLAPELAPLEVRTADGQTLSGWLLPRQGLAGPAPALVYFGGNAEEITGFFLDSLDLPGVSLAGADYRGYGRSTGQPGEAALKADALAVYDAAAARTGGRALVMGRSLGAGLAAHVAANRDVLAAVLVTPYDSILAVGREYYPFLPVGLLLKHPFEAVADAAGAAAPALFLVAGGDTVIAPARARALHDAWGGPKHWVLIAGADHNDLHLREDYRRALRYFLKEKTAEEPGLPR